MPNYCYGCEQCNETFETFAPMKDCAKKQPCPQCKSPCGRVYLAPTVVSPCTQFTTELTGGRQFHHPMHRKLYLDKARKAGVNVEGRVYYPELARFQGDPKAWVESSDDIKRVATENGFNVDGDVKVRAKRDIPPLDGGIAEHIVETRVNEILEQNPGMKRSKAVEDVVNRHAPPGKRRIIKAKKGKSKIKV